VLQLHREQQAEAQKHMLQLVCLQAHTHERALEEMVHQWSLHQQHLGETVEAEMRCELMDIFRLGDTVLHGGKERIASADGAADLDCQCGTLEHCAPDDGSDDQPDAHVSVALSRGTPEHGGSGLYEVLTRRFTKSRFGVQDQDVEEERQRKKRKAEDDYQTLMVEIGSKQKKNVFALSLAQHSVSWSSKRTELSQACEVPRIRRVVNSAPFFYMTAFAILANTIFVALVTDTEIRGAFRVYDRPEETSSQPVWVFSISLVFAVVFTVELCMRVGANFFRFWFGDDWKLNWCDLVVVAFTLMEVSTADAPGFSHMRVLRILRLFHTIRLLRIMRSLHQFRFMILAMVRSLIPLVSVVFFLMLITFIFAIIFVTGVVTYLEDAPPDDLAAETFRAFFPSVSMAVLSLFMSVTGGVNWWEFEKVFLQLSVFHGTLMVTFICVMVVAALNTVTAIFVSDAIDVAAMDKQITMHTHAQRRRAMVSELHELFRHLDGDMSGKITRNEFERFSSREDVLAKFKALDIDVDDATSFFDVLDLDHDEGLDIDEFVAGCFRVQGAATAASTHMLMEACHRSMIKSRDMAKNLQVRLETTENRLYTKMSRVQESVDAMQQQALAVLGKYSAISTVTSL